MLFKRGFNPHLLYDVVNMMATIHYFKDNSERMITTSLFGSKRDIYKSCRELCAYFDIDKITIDYPDGINATYVKRGSLWYKQ